MCVGVTNLNDVFLSPISANRGVVELLDDVFTYVACLEAGDQVVSARIEKKKFSTAQ